MALNLGRPTRGPALHTPPGGADAQPTALFHSHPPLPLLHLPRTSGNWINGFIDGVCGEILDEYEEDFTDSFPVWASYSLPEVLPDTKCCHNMFRCMQQSLHRRKGAKRAVCLSLQNMFLRLLSRLIRK